MKNRVMVKTLLLVFPLVCVVLLCASTFGGIIYVDADAVGANNGSSWADAFVYLQDGLAAAEAGDEIFVAEGIYRPDEGEGQTDGEKSSTFALFSGVGVYGGYIGSGAQEPNERNIDEYETILSGDLDGNDEPGFVNYGDNCYQVVNSRYCDSATVLD